MLTDKIKQLEAAKSQVAQLEQSIAAQLKGELAGLPRKYGFGDMASFIEALNASSGSRPAHRGRKPGRPAKSKVGRPRKTRKRGKVTDETRAQVKAMVEAGQTGAAIAKSLGVSMPTVQNIKKALGLVKARK